jgi:hypothetical protein
MFKSVSRQLVEVCGATVDAVKIEKYLCEWWNVENKSEGMDFIRYTMRNICGMGGRDFAYSYEWTPLFIRHCGYPQALTDICKELLGGRDKRGDYDLQSLNDLYSIIIHMAVVDHLMIFYQKEVERGDNVMNKFKRDKITIFI